MKLSALRITLIYLFLGMLWVVMGDFWLFSGNERIEPWFNWSMLKGIGFVSLSGFLLYILLKINEHQLTTASRDYRRLFRDNPNAMFIYNPEDYSILDANQAALVQYDYTKDEFLKLNLLDLRPEKEHERLKKVVKKGKKFQDSGIWIHQNKHGTEAYFHIYGNSTRYGGTDARLVVAINVDEQVRNREKILLKNKRLKEIAHMQAHDLRGPVSSILGLVSIFDKTNENQELNLEVIDKLESTASKLDDTIRRIVKKTDGLEEVENQ